MARIGLHVLLVARAACTAGTADSACRYAVDKYCTGGSIINIRPRLSVSAVSLCVFTSLKILPHILIFTLLAAND